MFSSEVVENLILILLIAADIPEAKDLETPLEVASWAWNWVRKYEVIMVVFVT